MKVNDWINLPPLTALLILPLLLLSLPVMALNIFFYDSSGTLWIKGQMDSPALDIPSVALVKLYENAQTKSIAETFFRNHGVNDTDHFITFLKSFPSGKEYSAFHIGYFRYFLEKSSGLQRVRETVHSFDHIQKLNKDRVKPPQVCLSKLDEAQINFDQIYQTIGKVSRERKQLHTLEEISARLTQIKDRQFQRRISAGNGEEKKIKINFQAQEKMLKNLEKILHENIFETKLLEEEKTTKMNPQAQKLLDKLIQKRKEICALKKDLMKIQITSFDQFSFLHKTKAFAQGVEKYRQEINLPNLKSDLCLVPNSKKI